MGQLSDFITGRTLNDTHDERYRQKIARLLVERKGYLKNDIETRKDLLVEAGDKRAIVKIDFLINLSGRTCMIIKYGPGSLITRRRPALAAARLLAPYQIPVAVVTNGEDAEVLELCFLYILLTFCLSRMMLLSLNYKQSPKKSQQVTVCHKKAQKG